MSACATWTRNICTSLGRWETATVNSARALNLDAGTLEPGKLADIALIEGDPRADIANTFKVKTVVANGVVHQVADLIAAVQ